MLEFATKSRRLLFAPLIALGFAAPQPAFVQETTVVAEFIGEWEGQGQLFGTEAKFNMKWAWALDRKFVRLTFRNSMVGEDGVERGLSAEAFYRPLVDGRLEGTWFDTRGIVLPLDAKADQTTLTTLWGTPATEQGKTVYRLLDSSQMEVTDFVLRDNEWNQFGFASYTRVSHTP